VEESSQCLAKTCAWCVTAETIQVRTALNESQKPLKETIVLILDTHDL